MRYGRTSIVNFLSQLAMSLSGFVATIVLTRTLGKDQYGTYLVVLSLMAWVATVGKVGILDALRKRVSESDTGNYILSGLVIQLCLYAVVAFLLWVARPYVNNYLGINATLILLLLLAARIGIDFTRAVLQGQHLVHISSVLSPIEWTVRSVVQIGLVILGFGISGAFAGYVVGAGVAIVIGSFFVSIPRVRPSRREFARLKSYAQFSWLSSVKGRTFLSMDTIVLAFFVSKELIAVYGIAWNVASLFAIFSASISTTLFPEISRMSSGGKSTDEISNLLRESLTYAGLFIIPGLVGSAIVGDVILTIYGSGFDTGYYVLLVLAFARLLYGYMEQFLTTVDAIDRPDLTFRVNASFVLANLGLNFLLTWAFGWYGAAAATTVSAALGLLLGYYYANSVIDVQFPFREITKQWLAAGIMAVAVLSGRVVLGEGLLTAILLVALGSVVYLAALLHVSAKFRTTVEDNLPFQLPTVLAK